MKNRAVEWVETKSLAAPKEKVFFQKPAVLSIPQDEFADEICKFKLLGTPIQ